MIGTSDYIYCTEKDFAGNIYSNSLPFGTLLLLSRKTWGRTREL